MKIIVILASVCLLSAPCILGVSLPSLPTKEVVIGCIKNHPVASVTLAASLVTGAFAKRTQVIKTKNAEGVENPILKHIPMPQANRIVSLVALLCATGAVEGYGYTKTSIGLGLLTTLGVMIHSAAVRDGK